MVLCLSGLELEDPVKCQVPSGCLPRPPRWRPRQPHRELLDDLLSLLQAGLQAAYELHVLRPGRPLPWLLSGLFQSVSSRHTISPSLQSLNREQGDEGLTG